MMKCVIVNPERLPQASANLAKTFSQIYNTDPDFRERVRQDLIKRGFIKRDINPSKHTEK